MRQSPATLPSCCQALTVAFTHKDICQLNKLLTATAERHPQQAPVQTKYDWIDAIQNGDLIYHHLAAPIISQLTDNQGQVYVLADLQWSQHATAPIWLQLTFIATDHHWQLYQQRDLSEKPIDGIR